LEDRDNIKIDLTNKKVRGHGLEWSGSIEGPWWVDEQPLALQEWLFYEVSILKIIQDCKIKGILIYVGFEVFTVVVMKSIILWDMTLCSPLSKQTTRRHIPEDDTLRILICLTFTQCCLIWRRKALLFCQLIKNAIYT
jgi:hypothetical protein